MTTGACRFKKEQPMNRVWNPISLALIMLALPGSVAPGFAQQATKDMVVFKATMAGEFRGLVIPLNPPIVSEQLTTTGQSDLLGQVTSVEHYFVRLGVDGKLASVTDGTAVLAAANGDALFLAYSGLASGNPAVEGEKGRQELAFIVTGGRGRFAGATGSGVIRDVLFRQGTPPKFSITRTFEGMITAPKP
jgi:hypothetical protein